jgi:DNA repair protein RadA/Sms
VLAVLEKGVGLALGGADVFVNIPGGIRAGEPATDLGMALAVASSLQETSMAADTACVGEVGLTGEVRSVPHLDRRLAELARCGFKRCLAPSRLSSSVTESERVEVVGVEDVSQALQAAFGA